MISKPKIRRIIGRTAPDDHTTLGGQVPTGLRPCVGRRYVGASYLEAKGETQLSEEFQG